VNVFEMLSFRGVITICGVFVGHFFGYATHKSWIESL
jgi:hypothetical protein